MGELLTRLKLDLGITTTAYDERLTQVLAAAQAAIVEAGGAIDENSPEDLQLVVMYAEWNWRARDDMHGMPRMVELALHSNILKNVGGGAASDG